MYHVDLSKADRTSFGSVEAILGKVMMQYDAYQSISDGVRNEYAESD